MLLGVVLPVDDAVVDVIITLTAVEPVGGVELMELAVGVELVKLTANVEVVELAAGVELVELATIVELVELATDVELVKLAAGVKPVELVADVELVELAAFEDMDSSVEVAVAALANVVRTLTPVIGVAIDSLGLVAVPTACELGVSLSSSSSSLSSLPGAFDELAVFGASGSSGFVLGLLEEPDPE